MALFLDTGLPQKVTDSLYSGAARYVKITSRFHNWRIPDCGLVPDLIE